MTDDERAEQAFRDTFRAHAEALEPAPLSVDPAPRRRTWPMVLTAAAAVLVVALGALAVRAHGTKVLAPSGGPPAQSAGLPDGWRWESHADVEVGVPDSWGYRAAPGADWCATYDEGGGASDGSGATSGTPYVDTTNGLGGRLDILCTRDVPADLMALHLSFVDVPDPGDNVLPSGVLSGWSTLARSVGTTQVVMTTDAAHEDLARQVLATAHVVEADQNGCAATSPIQEPHPVRPSPAFDVTTLTSIDSIAVCQYSTHGTDQPGLLASRLLTGEAARSELEALQSAPVGSGPNDPQNCIADGWGDTGVVLRLTSGDQTHDVYGYYEWCTHNGFDDGTAVRGLTLPDCAPLFVDRVIDSTGSAAAFALCSPPVDGAY